MNDEELKIHGSIFFLLKKFMDDSLSYGAWENLVLEADATDPTIDITQDYPLSLLNSLLSAMAALKGLSKNELEEKFGEFLVPDLLVSYAAFLKPHWKTFELLENTETVMHNAVRLLNNKANPPILNVSRVDDTLLIIDYYSKRKMGCLAIGIIKGIAKFYQEEDKIRILPTSRPEDERVQIRIEFNR